MAHTVSAARSAAISIRGVRKSYVRGGTEVLRGVDLDIASGESVALMGASGSGKTTLLNLIAGLDVADAGMITIGGEDLRRLDDNARSRFRLQHIGFVFQFFNILPNLSVGENIALPLLLLGRGDREADRRAAELCGEVGLAAMVSRMPHQLSGGEMQRVAIARALAAGPKLLLADEPTGNLDSRTGEAILELLHRTAGEHALTIIMATHDGQAAGTCSRAVRMTDGRVVSDS